MVVFEVTRIEYPFVYVVAVHLLAAAKFYLASHDIRAKNLYLEMKGFFLYPQKDEISNQQ